jgi:hypothetical protein
MDQMIRRWLGEDAEDIVSASGKSKLSLASHRRVFWD